MRVAREGTGGTSVGSSPRPGKPTLAPPLRAQSRGSTSRDERRKRVAREGTGGTSVGSSPRPGKPTLAPPALHTSLWCGFVLQ